MVKRLLAVLGLLTVVISLSVPAFAVEGVSERQARKRMEASKYPQQASEALQNNNPDLAIELFTKTINSKAFADQPQAMGEIYFGRGNAYRMKKDCTAAIADYDKAIEQLQKPGAVEHGDIYFTRAACHLELKEDDKGLADLDAAVKLDPDATMYRSARCKVLFNRQDFAGALPDCEKAVVKSQNDKDLLVALAQASERTGDKARAAEAYRAILVIEPGNQMAIDGLKRVGG